MKPIASILLLCLVVPVLSRAQEQPQQPSKTPISPSARLAAAKTAYVKNGNPDGSDIPFNVISSGIDGWGHFVTVDAPDRADVVIEIAALGDKSRADDASNSGKTPAKRSQQLDVDSIKLTVYDAKTHLALWNALERPKGAFKDRALEDNIVEASERLLARFRDRIEPPAAPETTPEKSK